MAEDIEERTMELTIEALTGTVYDLCVSPYETILGIKMKVQRLEGIPVYQQQLVWGGIELQDEFCLEEYSIPSGAQLKLLVAMRGGPIHAQRVHLDLEDPALFEIAELLDSQGGDKYTLMLLRNGDDLDHASIVQLQMLEEDDTVRLSPIPVVEPSLSMGNSKATRMEHAITRDKMKELLSKFKKDKEYRHHASSLSHTPPPPLSTTAAAKPSQLSCKGTGKVLILESRASSRLLHRNSSSRATPLLSTCVNESRQTQRKLLFSGNECLHGQQQTASSSTGASGSRKRMTSCSLTSSRRTRNRDEEAPCISRKSCSRVSKDSISPSCLSMDDTSVRQSELGHLSSSPHINAAGAGRTEGSCCSGSSNISKDWHKSSKRRRRTSCVEQDVAAITNLTKNLTHLKLNSTATSDHPYTTDCKTTTTTTTSTKPCVLPPIAYPRLPSSLTSATPKVGQTLPSLAIGTSNKQNLNRVTRKKRCMKCGKKMGLASTYSCRCGGLFCANHRYAEVHSCTFDYKTEGRQILARTNPVVAAQKLPKI